MRRLSAVSRGSHSDAGGVEASTPAVSDGDGDAEARRYGRHRQEPGAASRDEDRKESAD